MLVNSRSLLGFSISVKKKTLNNFVCWLDADYGRVFTFVLSIFLSTLVQTLFQLPSRNLPSFPPIYLSLRGIPNVTIVFCSMLFILTCLLSPSFVMCLLLLNSNRRLILNAHILSSIIRVKHADWDNFLSGDHWIFLTKQTNTIIRNTLIT